MASRLIKNNILLMVVIGGSLVISVGLLVMVALRYMDMQKNIQQIETLRKKMEQLKRPKSVSPAKENLEAMKVDKEFYQKKIAEIRTYFGNPYREALAAAAAAIYQAPAADLPEEQWTLQNKVKDVDAFVAAMRQALGGLTQGVAISDEAAKVRHAALRSSLAKLSASLGASTWKTMMAAFEEKAQPASVEKISEDRLDDFFLFTLGFQRAGDFAGSLTEVKSSLAELCAANNVILGGRAADFAIGDVDNAAAAVNMDIVADLAKRVIVSGIDSFNNIYRHSNTTELSKDFEVHSYRVEISGSLDSIRNVARNLGLAYTERRVYVIRGIQLRRQDDGANWIISRELEREKTKAMVVNSISTTSSEKNANEKTEKVVMKSVFTDPTTVDLDKPLEERRGYGVPVLGNTVPCYAIIDVDYLIYKPAN